MKGCKGAGNRAQGAGYKGAGYGVHCAGVYGARMLVTGCINFMA